MWTLLRWLPITNSAHVLHSWIFDSRLSPLLSVGGSWQSREDLDRNPLSQSVALVDGDISKDGPLHR